MNEEYHWVCKFCPPECRRQLSTASVDVPTPGSAVPTPQDMYVEHGKSAVCGKCSEERPVPTGHVRVLVAHLRAGASGLRGGGRRPGVSNTASHNAAISLGRRRSENRRRAALGLPPLHPEVPADPVARVVGELPSEELGAPCRYCPRSRVQPTSGLARFGVGIPETELVAEYAVAVCSSCVADPSLEALEAARFLSIDELRVTRRD